MSEKSIGAFAVVALAVCAALWAACRDGSHPTSQPAPVQQTAMEGLIPYRGMAIQVASGYYRARETYGALLREVAGLGANSVLLCLPGQMEHAHSQSIFMDLRKIPPPDDLKAIIGDAKQLGLRTFVMPIVLLRNPRGSEWRGVIDPPDWEDWWQQYFDFVLFFADVCRESGADALLVGSELVSAEKYTSKWEDLIGQARQRFYGGKLGYSANWDHYRPIEFWGLLDFMGMTSYYTLADRKNASVQEIVDRWEPIRKDILAWQRRIGKPILLTEVGWCSQEGAATAPWNYYQNQVASAEGLEEQRRLYEAFLRSWGKTPELMGVIWWEWDTSPGGATDYGYSPKGKPAEEVLRRWFREGNPPRGDAAIAPDGTAAPTGASTADGASQPAIPPSGECPPATSPAESAQP